MLLTSSINKQEIPDFRFAASGMTSLTRLHFCENLYSN